jgi:hypothetical protein
VASRLGNSVFVVLQRLKRVLVLQLPSINHWQVHSHGECLGQMENKVCPGVVRSWGRKMNGAVTAVSKRWRKLVCFLLEGREGEEEKG